MTRAWAARPPRLASSWEGPPPSPGSGWTGRKPRTGGSATRCTPTRPASHAGSVMQQDLSGRTGRGTTDGHPSRAAWFCHTPARDHGAGGRGTGRGGRRRARAAGPRRHGGPGLPGAGAADLCPAGPAGHRVHRAGPAQGPGPRDRGAAAGRPAAAGIRPGVFAAKPAHVLYRPENERDYGQEAIEILLQVMEAHREDLVVILA